MRKLTVVGSLLLVVGVLLGRLSVQPPAAAMGGDCAYYNGDADGTGTAYVGESAGASERGINITDAINILNWLFLGGSAPKPLCAQQELEACQAQQATCVADLGTAQGERDACASNLGVCQTERDQALADLATRTAERDAALSSLAACQTERDSLLAALETCQADLARCVQPPATGQTLCYDDVGNVIDCASPTYPGQDGFYLAGCPSAGRFVDHQDGTVTDTCTGLMWQKNTAPGTFLWQGALGYCEGLGLAGHDDWRLPNLRELRTLLDYGGGEPAIDPVFQAIPEMYWTSSTWNADPTHAFTVGFQLDEGNNHEAKIDPFPVRAVRGGK